jgi:hypothetical protein
VLELAASFDDQLSPVAPFLFYVVIAGIIFVETGLSKSDVLLTLSISKLVFNLHSSHLCSVIFSLLLVNKLKVYNIHPGTLVSALQHNLKR